MGLLSNFSNFVKSKVFGLDSKQRNQALEKCEEEVKRLREENIRLKEKVKKLEEENSYLKKEQERFGLSQNYEVEYFIDFVWKGHNKKGDETSINAYLVVNGVVNKDVNLDKIKQDLSKKDGVVNLMEKLNFTNVDKNSNFQSIQVGDNTSKTSKPISDNLNVSYIVGDEVYEKSSSDVKLYGKRENIGNYLK